MLSLSIVKKLFFNTALIFVLALAGCSGDSSDADADADADINCLTKRLSVSAATDSTDTDTDDCDTADTDSDGVLDSADSCNTIYDPANTCADTDADGFADDYDNCASLANQEQTDGDGDGLGDDCDPNPTVVDTVENDTDGDLISDDSDNCPSVYNPSQSTASDTDTIADACDNCSAVSNQDQSDIDADGIGDGCDDDSDGDGIANASDNCPNAPNASQTDADGDGLGYVCDQDDANAAITNNDADGDGILDDVDNCDASANADQANADGDELGNACDTDDDNDGLLDDVDTCPTDPTDSCTEPDADGDGIGDSYDLCPGLSSTNNTDTDGDGVGDACDTDSACGETNGTIYYKDADGDGYGDPDSYQYFCETDHTGYVTDNTDCQDEGILASWVYPGSTYMFGSFDCGIDNDTGNDGDTTTDADNDGLAVNIDPDDSHPNVWYYIQNVVTTGQKTTVSGSKEFVEAEENWLGMPAVPAVYTESADGTITVTSDAIITVAGVTDASKVCDRRTSCTTARSLDGMSPGSGHGSLSGSLGGLSADSEYGICILTDTTATCDNDDGASETTDTDGDGRYDDEDNCVDEPNANQSDRDGDGIGDACDSSNYALDSVTMFFRGFNLDFEGDNAFEIAMLNAGFVSNLTATDINSVSSSVGSGFGKLDYSLGSDPAYYWTIYGTAVQYDSATMKTYSGSYLEIRACDESDGDCSVQTDLDVKTIFGEDFATDDYFYVANIKGIYIYANDLDTPSTGAEDLNASVWIHNDETQTNALDYDNSDGSDSSNGNDHYVGSNGKLRVHVNADFNGPTNTPRFNAVVHYTVTAFKTDVWGYKHYAWDKDSDEECHDEATLSGLSGIIDKEHAFIIPYSLGYDSAQSETREIDQIYSNLKLESVDAGADTATVSGYGCVKGHKGTGPGSDDFYINANDTKGYLLYCKNANVCNTKQDSTGTLTEAHGGSTGGDAVDTATLEITF